jgi:TM2 domain-containing membrane protein YozV
METTEYSPRSRLAALLLCLLLGVFGAHRFYAGKIGTGVLMLLTLGGLGIWTLIDLILILIGSLRDKEDRRIFLWLEPGSF